MAAISKQRKAALGEILAKGHSHFGKVAPRRPYLDDEDGGTGESDLIPTHPLLGDVQLGAASDLTAIVSDHDNREILEEANTRDQELNPQMQQKLSKTLGKSFNPKPSMG